MPKIHHSPTSKAHPPKTHEEPIPSLRETSPSAPAKDSFLKRTIREVYENTPLVMLCTKPDLRELVSRIPVIKEVADAVCPAFEAVERDMKK